MLRKGCLRFFFTKKSFFLLNLKNYCIFTVFLLEEKNMSLKKMNNKYAFWVVLFIFVSGMLISCAPPQYRHYKKMVKRRTSYYGYKSSYQKKLKKNTLPVNRNYIIKNKRTTPSWR